MDLQTILMIIGFSLAAYSIVANDAIQTLGTFLASNSHRPWWVLWLFAMSILSAVLVYGWYTHGGDASYGRLSKFPPPDAFTWIYLLPPVFVLLLTRFGVPVSTTFLVLTVFVTANLEKMLMKSLLGYVVAIAVGLVVYLVVAAQAEKYFIRTADEKKPEAYWTVLQWVSTGFLWSQWLMHDLANIFIYAPTAGMNAEGVRTISETWLWAALAWFFILHAVIFYQRGGGIQKIVTSKTNTQDIRSATIVDFIYAIILVVFKQMSNIPMSTTWVFLGLLAGREFAIAWVTRLRKPTTVAKIVGTDMGKAGIGLAVSVALAFLAPSLKNLMTSPSEPTAKTSISAPATSTLLPQSIEKKKDEVKTLEKISSAEKYTELDKRKEGIPQ